MSPPLMHVAEALSRPLLFHPAKLELILAAIGGRIGLEADRPSPEASRFVGEPSRTGAYRVENGIAIISIVGSLANRGAYIGASSGVLSYEGIGAQIRQAAGDASVRGIILDINSGGGEATGMFRLAAQIREIRKSKRIVAYVDDVAASAAYGIAASASEIVVSPTSIVGSIGVVLAHVDRSGELAAKGQRVTLIHAGANKVDGHPFGPLSDQVRADLQAEVLAFYDQFVASVAAGRPKLSVQAIRQTEARTFIGEAAIKAGLADRVASLEEVLASFNSSPSAPQSRGATQGIRIMSESSKFGGYVDGYDDGIAAERNRIVGILQSEEGKKRPKLALEMALDGAGMSADTVGRLLAKLPVEGASRGSGQSFSHGAGGRRDHIAGLNAAVDAIAPKPSAHAGGAPGPAPAEASQARTSGLFAAVDRMTGGPAGSSRS